jgi:predicted nicotinamide N-methyase
VQLDLVEEVVDLGSRQLSILRPRDAEALIDERAFERDEFLPYWAELWPAGVALARAVGERELAGQRVLELGCGLALPSLAAAVGGARVLATDWSADAVELVAVNARRAGVAVEAAAVVWSEPERLLAAGTFDLVLAADVLYERRHVDALLPLLAALRAPEILLADPARPYAQAFLRLAANDWEIERIVEQERPRVTLYALRRDW